MNIRHVVLAFLCSVCVCVCDISSTVQILANQTTQNPDHCVTSNCLAVNCTRAVFSEEDSKCIFLKCDNDTSCDHFITALGSKAQNEGLSQKNEGDPLQPPSSSPKSPHSPSTTAPPASLSASAAPLSPPVPLPGPEGKQNGYPGQAPSSSLENGHQGQPPVKPSTPAPTSPPVPIATVRAGNISSTVPKDQNGTQANKTGQETTTTTTTTSSTFNSSTTTSTITNTTSTTTSSTSTTTTTTTSVKPALSINSTTATNTTFTTKTVTPTTTSTNTPATRTTNKVTSPPSTTQIPPTSTPPPTPPPSPAPPFLPSVTPSIPPPGHNPSTTTPKVLGVTSDQGKAIVPGAGESVSHMVNTSSLIAVLIFGLLFFIVTVILFLRHAYESYKRRGYTQMDYLINGMYADSGL